MKEYMRWFFVLSITSCLNNCLVDAWDHDQLEIFDIVEEVNRNFYELLGVGENAETSEIKKAYRKLSLTLHPDRNSAEDAEVQFRQLVAVYEVLKNSDKRELYDTILRDGLPDWRQPVYYYRKARKLGLVEMFVILFVISTVGHYLVIWAMYLEKKFELEEVLFSQMKRKHEKEMKRKRERNGAGLDRLAEGVSEMVGGMLEAPTLYRLLPVQLGLAAKNFIVTTPENYRQLVGFSKEAWEAALAALRRRKEKEESDGDEEEDEGEGEEETKVKRSKRKRVVLPEYAELENSSHHAAGKDSSSRQPSSTSSCSPSLPTKANAPWTEEDLSKLSKAMARYPTGTLNRWEKVAEFTERTVNEIMAKNKEIRDSQYNKLNQVVSSGVAETAEDRAIVKKGKKSAQAMAALSTTSVTKRDEEEMTMSGGDVDSDTTTTTAVVDVASKDDEGWTQNQQKIFEWALAQYPKGTAERWDKIAEHIPGKTKTDCVLRFKFIVETLKQKKTAAI